MDKFTLDVSPSGSNRRARFTIWDNTTGEKHSSEIVHFESPDGINKFKKIWSKQVAELNKPDYALQGNPYAKASNENYE